MPVVMVIFGKEVKLRVRVLAVLLLKLNEVVGVVVELFNGGAVVVLMIKVVETLTDGVKDTLDDEEGGTVTLLTDEVDLTTPVLDDDSGGMLLLCLVSVDEPGKTELEHARERKNMDTERIE